MVIAWNVSHLPGRNPDGRGASTCADYRFEARTFRVFGSIGFVDAIVYRSIVHRDEGNLLRYADGSDSSRLLPYCERDTSEIQSRCSHTPNGYHRRPHARSRSEYHTWRRPREMARYADHPLRRSCGVLFLTTQPCDLPSLQSMTNPPSTEMDWPVT